MRVSEIANMIGLTSKEVIQEVEALREDLTSQGYKIAKKLTAASSVDDQAVRLVMAAVDARNKAARAEEEAKEEAARREEEERKRKEEEARRAAELEARKKQIEEARRKADEELARRRAELERIASQQAAAPPPPPPPAPLQPPPPSAPPAARRGAAPPPPPPAAMPQPGRAPAPPREASEGGRPAAPPSHPSQSDRPAARRPGPPPPIGDSANAQQLESLIARGIQPTVTDDYKQRRREEPKKDRPRPETDAERNRRRKAAAPAGRERKHFKPTEILRGEVVARRPPPRVDRPRKSKSTAQRRQARRTETPKSVALRGDFTVGQFAERLRVPASDIIARLMGMGEMLTVNQVLSPELAELIAIEMGVEVEIEREGDEYDVEKYVSFDTEEEQLRPRPPVVTVMGHVDHGKTTLLDHIRKANVVAGESGGITQHIGAYYVNTAKGDIVFLDTPGHEAFTAMRARGATVTDLVVLVVAANDGVKPQTVEAINHAKAAEVPIVVAINKMDVVGANADRVKNELMRFELVSEDLGGDILMVPISAATGENIDTLLENIALQAEVLELTANPDRPALGTVVESQMDKNRGAVATLLVQEGTLRLGDIFVCGTEFGRIRAMRDDHGNLLTEAGPATPVEIMGLSGSPGAGEQFVVMPDEASARDIAERRQARRKMRSAAATPHVTLESLAGQLQEGETKNLNLIVKGDVQGSIEAINASLLKIKSDKIILRILHSGVGAIGEADVQLADASDAIVIGFNVRPDVAGRQLAEKLGVEIRTYSIIYQLLEEIEAAMVGLLEPVFEEIPMAHIEVRETFKVTKVGTIAGCYVAEGTVGRNHKARLVRQGTVVWKGEIASLRRHKDDVKEVPSGLECGIGLSNFNDVKVGDEIETFVLKEKAASLVSEPQPAASSAGSQE